MLMSSHFAFLIDKNIQSIILNQIYVLILVQTRILCFTEYTSIYNIYIIIVFLKFNSLFFIRYLKEYLQMIMKYKFIFL